MSFLFIYLVLLFIYKQSSKQHNNELSFGHYRKVNPFKVLQSRSTLHWDPDQPFEV